MARGTRHWRRSPVSAGNPSPWRMVLVLAVLALVYSEARRPRTWQWLAASEEPPAAREPIPELTKETVIPGPVDTAEMDERSIRDKFLALTDKADMSTLDMPAYWVCMRWALAQSFDELTARAQRGLKMSQLWEEPDKYRATIVRLALHIRMIEEHPAPENSAKVDRVFEVWGWTDDSKSLPFCCVVPELPPDMKPGVDLSYEGVFVGYFLKWMKYSPGVGKDRSSPILIGRIRSIPNALARNAPPTAGSWIVWLIFAVVAVPIGWLAWSRRSTPMRRVQTAAPHEQEAALAFLQGALGPDHGLSPMESMMAKSGEADSATGGAAT